MKTSFPFSVPAKIANRLTPLASTLWWSWQETRLLDCDPCALALPVDTLLNGGLTQAVLQWLVERRLLAQRHSPTKSRHYAPGHRAQRDADLLFVTESGAAFLAQYCLHQLKPNWDPQHRVLCVEGHAIKAYRQPSVQQETVLCAFQEDGWPDQIDDPLPRDVGIVDNDAKVRLRQTVNNLNRAQRPSTIFFSAAGNGERIAWSFTYELIPPRIHTHTLTLPPVELPNLTTPPSTKACTIHVPHMRTLERPNSDRTPPLTLFRGLGKVTNITCGVELNAHANRPRHAR